MPVLTPPGTYGTTVAAASTMTPNPSTTAAPIFPCFTFEIKELTPKETFAASHIVSNGMFPSGSTNFIGFLLSQNQSVRYAFL